MEIFGYYVFGLTVGYALYFTIMVAIDLHKKAKKGGGDSGELMDTTDVIDDKPRSVSLEDGGTKGFSVREPEAADDGLPAGGQSREGRVEVYDGPVSPADDAAGMPQGSASSSQSAGGGTADADYQDNGGEADGRGGVCDGSSVHGGGVGSYDDNNGTDAGSRGMYDDSDDVGYVGYDEDRPQVLSQPYHQEEDDEAAYRRLKAIQEERLDRTAPDMSSDYPSEIYSVVLCQPLKPDCRMFHELIAV